MVDLPSGTVTLLFTDIEGSTRLLQEIGRDRYMRALSDQRRLLREAVARHRGVEVEMQGDSFHFAFADGRDAVAAAADSQRALAGHPWQGAPMRVRMGIHTGQPAAHEGLYAGLDVHRAARVMSAGHGGQVLLTEATVGLLDPSLEIVDLGLHRLKDLSEPQRLYQLGAESYPPLKTLYQTNLPVPATPFLGRERELDDVLALLRSNRLITLTGPGGSGKTRLAAQAAAEAADDFPDGVWWVSLAALHEPGLLLDSIAQTLGAKTDVDEHIADKQLLLLLDNLEQLLPAAPELAGLLAHCPRLHLLVTSREPLQLAAEQEYPVPPFADEEAITFFSARARAVEPHFRPTDAIGAICRRLDNLPLALELAAARVKVLSPEQILTRLDRRLPLLTGGPRDAPERQRTLAATIAWSYELMTESEQQLFARLSVFAGGCTLEAAEEVADADLDMLSSLVDKSLTRRTHERFWMLETIREYARERLDELGEGEDRRRRHAAWAVELGRRASEATGEAEVAIWADREAAELDNLRAAFEWASSAGRRRVALELAVRLARFSQASGLLTEGRRLVEFALADAAEIPVELRLRALHEASAIAFRQGDRPAVALLAEEELTLARSLGDAREIVRALVKLVTIAAESGDDERAAALGEEALATARESGDHLNLLNAQNALGLLQLGTGRYDTAVVLLEECVSLARSAGTRRDTVANATFNVALAHALRGEEQSAVAPLGEALAIYRELGHGEGIGYCFELEAALAVSNGRPQEAARLLGKAELLLEEAGATLERPEAQLHVRTTAHLATELDDAELRRLWAEGRASAAADLDSRARADDR